jgi:hypothetical protein
MEVKRRQLIVGQAGISSALDQLVSASVLPTTVHVVIVIRVDQDSPVHRNSNLTICVTNWPDVKAVRRWHANHIVERAIMLHLDKVSSFHQYLPLNRRPARIAIKKAQTIPRITPIGTSHGLSVQARKTPTTQPIRQTHIALRSHSTLIRPPFS